MTGMMYFMRNLYIEGALLLGVLLFAAALSQQSPPAHAEHDQQQQEVTRSGISAGQNVVGFFL